MAAQGPDQFACLQQHLLQQFLRWRPTIALAVHLIAVLHLLAHLRCPTLATQALAVLLCLQQYLLLRWAATTAHLGPLAMAMAAHVLAALYLQLRLRGPALASHNRAMLQ